MAGIRGIRNPFPSKGKKPTGIFSSRGKQKQDGASGPDMGALSYAHRKGNDKKCGARSSSGGKGPMHQAPRSKAGGPIGTRKSIKM